MWLEGASPIEVQNVSNVIIIIAKRVISSQWINLMFSLPEVLCSQKPAVCN